MIAPQRIMKWNVVRENEWGDLECLYKAYQTAMTTWGIFTDSGVNEWSDDEWQQWNWRWNERQGKRSENWRNRCNRLRWKWLVKEEGLIAELR